MKGVVLHGGAGTRLRPLTFSGPKQLIPIANKPVSQYVLEDLVASGIRDIAIVLGEVFPELVKERYKDGSELGARISYVYQGRPLGIAHAVGLCKEFLGEDSFVVYLGDNLLQEGVKPYVDSFVSGDYNALILLKEVEDPTKFGVAQFSEQGRLVRLIEKPKVPPSKYALVGVYFFQPIVFEFIKRLKPSWRGELEITDTIQLMLEAGCRVGHRFVKGWWLDTGKKDDVLFANSLILDERARREVEGEVVDSVVEGRVKIGRGSRVVRSTVRGPCVVGRDCVIEDSFVGPYTSVGDGTRILNSQVEYCVILEGATVRDVERLEESLVGRNAVIARNRSRRALRLNVGDYSEVNV